MTKTFGLTCIVLLSLGAEASAACAGLRFSGSPDQAVDARLRVTSGDPCGIRMRHSGNPIHSTVIVRRPSNGTATAQVNRVIYRSRVGFVGNDTFTYAMRGHRALNNNPVVYTVQVLVTVYPKKR